MRTARALTDRISWCRGGGRGGACVACTPPVTHPSPLWTEFLTHASENITLPQTSFAGGNDVGKVLHVQTFAVMPFITERKGR